MSRLGQVVKPRGGGAVMSHARGYFGFTDPISNFGQLLMGDPTIWEDTDSYFDVADNQIVFPFDGWYIGQCTSLLSRTMHDAGDNGWFTLYNGTSSDEADEAITAPIFGIDASHSPPVPQLTLPWNRHFLANETMTFSIGHYNSNGLSIGASMLLSVALLSRD